MPSLQRPQQDSPAAIRQALANAFDMLERYEEWHEIASTDEPNYLNGWVKGTVNAAYRIDVAGNVYLRGIIVGVNAPGSGNGTVAFQLPNGYRPLVAVRIPSNGSQAGVFYPANIDVATNGNVTITLRGLGANLAVADVSLHGSFRIF